MIIYRNDEIGFIIHVVTDAIKIAKNKGLPEIDIGRRYR